MVAFGLALGTIVIQVQMKLSVLGRCSKEFCMTPNGMGRMVLCPNMRSSTS